MTSRKREAAESGRDAGGGPSENAPGTTFHRLLRQQFEAHFGSMEATPELLRPLLAKISDAYQQAEEEQGRFEVLLDSASESLCWTDMDGRILRINRAGARLLGYDDPEELIGVSGFEFVTDESMDDAVGTLDQGRKGRQGLTSEYEIKLRDGSARSIETHHSFVQGPDGKPTGQFVITRDITDRKLMEQEREEAHAFLGSIIENIPDMVFVKDAEHLRFVRVNAAAEELLGYAREEMIGKSDHDFFLPEVADFFTANDREVLASGVLKDIPEEPVNTRHRGQRLLHTKKIPIPGPDGQPKYLLGISEDITDRKRAEDAEREAEKLRELDRLKNNFLSNVSHELRTPLVSLQGYVELLLKHDVKEEKARDWLRVVLRSSKRLEGIINGLLEISRLQSGNLNLQSGPVDLGELVAQCALSVRPQLSSKNITLRQRVASDLPQVTGDRQRLQSVLLNLLDNAIKFSPDDGTITVDIRTRDPENVQISVSDEGIGVAPSHHDRIFERFFQVESSPTRKYGGSGIGLALARDLVEAHGGRVWVESAVGEGATFHVRLPVRETNAAPRLRGEAGSSRPRVLVVDDDPDIRDLVGTMLESEGCEARIAASGEEALTALTGRDVDLILLDLAMPGLGGTEVCAMIKGDPKYQHIPVYIVTAFTGHESRSAAREAGADGFIEKPFSVEALENLLDSIGLGRHAG